jgi:hypothetical protein
MMPGPFVQLGQPWNERHHLPSGATTFDLPAIEVVKGVEIRGRLVDMADRPIANRQVVGGTEQRRYAFATSDQNGEFTTNSVPPGIKRSYSVWVNDHEQPVDVTILKEEPLLLRVPIGPNVPKNEGPRPDCPGYRGHQPGRGRTADWPDDLELEGRVNRATWPA